MAKAKASPADEKAWQKVRNAFNVWEHGMKGKEGWPELHQIDAATMKAAARYARASSNKTVKYIMRRFKKDWQEHGPPSKGKRESAPHSHLHRLVEAREEAMNQNMMTEARKLAGLRPVLPSLEEAASGNVDASRKALRKALDAYDPHNASVAKIKPLLARLLGSLKGAKADTMKSTYHLVRLYHQRFREMDYEDKTAESIRDVLWHAAKSIHQMGGGAFRFESAESESNLTEAKTYKKGQMLKLRLGHPPKIETYKVLRVYPTKEHATGPFPTTLTRLIRKGGGAILVELQPSKKSMEKDGGIHTPGPRGGSWRPKEYIVYTDAEGNVDGAPVSLKPHQFKRVMSYRESIEREDTMQEALGVPDLNKWKITQKGGKTFYTIKLHGKTVTVREKGEPPRSGLYRYRIFIDGKRYQRQDETEIKGVMRTVQTAVMKPHTEALSTPKTREHGIDYKLYDMVRAHPGIVNGDLIKMAMKKIKVPGFDKDDVLDFVDRYSKVGYITAKGHGWKVTAKAERERNESVDESVEPIEEMDIMDAEEKVSALLAKAETVHGKAKRKILVQAAGIMKKSGLAKERDWVQQFNMRAHDIGLSLSTIGTKHPMGGLMKAAGVKLPEHADGPVADGQVLVTESVQRYRHLAGLDPLPRPMVEYRAHARSGWGSEMTLSKWIAQNRTELKRMIKRAVPNIGKLDDDDLEQWVMNDEGLYRWAQSDGVDLD